MLQLQKEPAQQPAAEQALRSRTRGRWAPWSGDGPRTQLQADSMSSR